MNRQNILSHRVNDLALGRCRAPVRDAVVGQLADQEGSVYGNYLPGLRVIERDSEKYFDNDFIWLGS